MVEITPDAIVIETPAGRETLRNDFVFAMTGYHPDFTFLERLGVRFEGPDRLPVCDPETLESNVPGIYLAGVIVAGSRTNEIFIENGRFHGRQIALRCSGKAEAAATGARDPVAASDSSRLRSRSPLEKVEFAHALVASINSLADARGSAAAGILSIGLFAALLTEQQSRSVYVRAQYWLTYEATSMAMQVERGA